MLVSLLKLPSQLYRAQLDSGYRSSQHTRGLWGMDSNKPPKDSYHRLTKERKQGLLPKLHPHWPLWDKELTQHAKRLRNNFMYMGPTHSFAHLYEAPRKRIYKIPSEDQMEWAHPAVFSTDNITSEVGIPVAKEDVWPLD